MAYFIASSVSCERCPAAISHPPPIRRRAHQRHSALTSLALSPGGSTRTPHSALKLTRRYAMLLVQPCLNSLSPLTSAPGSVSVTAVYRALFVAYLQPSRWIPVIADVGDVLHLQSSSSIRSRSLSVRLNPCFQRSLPTCLIESHIDPPQTTDEITPIHPSVPSLTPQYPPLPWFTSRNEQSRHMWNSRLKNLR